MKTGTWSRQNGSRYLSLLDWTGRRKVSGKSGSIPDHLALILERLNIRPQRWLESVENFEKWFGRVVGRAENLARHVARSGRRWIRCAGRCADVFI